MADRSHLTPVRTTDRRGRTTPAEDSAEVLRRILTAQALVASSEGRAALSLAMELADGSALEPSTIGSLLSEFNPEDGRLAAGFTNALRLTAKLVAEGRLDEPNLQHWHPSVIAAAVRGLTIEAPEDGCTLTEDDSLDKAVAAVLFIFSFKNSRAAVARHKDLYLTRMHRFTVRNPRLSDLISQRPADIDQIIAHVRARGAHPKGSGTWKSCGRPRRHRRTTRRRLALTAG